MGPANATNFRRSQVAIRTVESGRRVAGTRVAAAAGAGHSTEAAVLTVEGSRTWQHFAMDVALLVYPGLTMLDAIGPYTVFGQTPGWDVQLVAAAPGLLRDDLTRVTLDVERTLADTPHPDVVVVPGGFVTRAMAQDPQSAEVAWLRAVYPSATWVASVCTGSLLLGAAGLLGGLTASTHWGAVADLESYGATYVTERVVVHPDRRIVTAAGVSSGIDMALTLIGAAVDPMVAQAIQLGIEYDPQPPYDAGSPTKAPADVVELVRGAMAQRS